MRTDMIDNDQIYIADYYARKDKKVEVGVDIPDVFNFEYVDDNDKKAEDTFVISTRRSTAESIKIQTDSELDFKPDEIVIIDGLQYNITSVQLIRNSSYDLRTLRGGTNFSKLMILDK